jgi:HSP20 family molecular chaperone IbpA
MTMISTQPRPLDLEIVMPAMTMYTNLQYQVIRLDTPALRPDSAVVATDGDDLVVTAEGADCHYYRRIPLSYRAPRQRIEVRPTDGVLEIRVPNPDLPRA